MWKIYIERYTFFFSAFSDISNAFPNISEQVIKETESFLSKRDLTSLDEEKSSLLRQQIMNLSDEGNNICQLISKFWGVGTVFIPRGEIFRTNTERVIPYIHQYILYILVHQYIL